MENIKKKMNNGEIVFGMMLSEVATPNTVRIMDAAGYEFMIVDCEHGYFDFSQLANLASVGNGLNMTMLVRIPAIAKEFVAKCLDMSMDGVLVPMVNTAEDAKKIVQLVKYPPMGTRGISTTRAHTNYAPPALDEYIKNANQRTIIMVQIESRQAVENVDEIAAVDGIDALMVGPNDMAVDFGTPGKLETPEMEAAIFKVIEASKKAGKPCGIIDSHVPFLRKWRDRGMNIFSCGSEVGMIMSSAKSNYEEFFSK